MRLLNIHTRRLEEFHGVEIPPYAILSHTWERDEVFFADIGTSEAVLKTGYKKIDCSCREASRRELRYIWVDTCCIDKSNNTELSEAINSMFRWYQNAEVCFAYLVDITKKKYNTTGLASRWFSRGWTLQELLAPVKVEFFDNAWVPLGSKHDLAMQISALTKIDAGCLLGRTELRQKSIATRMSWAASRETTRKEDLAYCLLGIFDVNVPLIYGEGPRAFQRLQEEIIRVSDDQSILAWGFRPEFWISATQRMVACFETTGPLAPSPQTFHGSASLLPIRYSKTRAPFMMTNQGLQITLPVTKDYQDKTIGLINCGFLGEDHHCIGILLERTGTGRLIRTGVRSPDNLELYSTFLVPIEFALKATLQTIHIGGRPGVSLVPDLAQSVAHRLIDIDLDIQKSILKCAVHRALPNDVELDRENMLLRLPRSRNPSTAIIVLRAKHSESERKESEFAVFIQLPDEDIYGNRVASKVKLFQRNSLLEQVEDATAQNLKGTLLDPHDQEILSFYDKCSSDLSFEIQYPPLPNSGSSYFVIEGVEALLERIEITNHRAYRVKITLR